MTGYSAHGTRGTGCQLHVMSVLQRIISRGDHHVITSVTRPRAHYLSQCGDNTLVDGEHLNCQESESVSTVKLVVIFSMIVKGLLSCLWSYLELNTDSITKVQK